MKHKADKQDEWFEYRVQLKADKAYASTWNMKYPAVGEHMVIVTSGKYWDSIYGQSEFSKTGKATDMISRFSWVMLLHRTLLAERDEFMGAEQYVKRYSSRNDVLSELGASLVPVISKVRNSKIKTELVDQVDDVNLPELNKAIDEWFGLG